MSRLRDYHQLLDIIFRHEKEISEAEWQEKIVKTYAAAKAKNEAIYKLAERRYRGGEHYIKTCLAMCISPSQYYRMLNIFFKIAEKNCKSWE